MGATAEQVTRHARIELPDGDYQRPKRPAGWVHMSAAAHIRQAAMGEIAEDGRRRGAR